MEGSKNFSMKVVTFEAKRARRDRPKSALRRLPKLKVKGIFREITPGAPTGCRSAGDHPLETDEPLALFCFQQKTASLRRGGKVN